MYQWLMFSFYDIHIISSNLSVICGSPNTMCQKTEQELQYPKQGKSEGFESCDRPIVWKRPIWVKIGDV